MKYCLKSPEAALINYPHGDQRLVKTFQISSSRHRPDRIFHFEPQAQSLVGLDKASRQFIHFSASTSLGCDKSNCYLPYISASNRCRYNIFLGGDIISAIVTPDHISATEYSVSAPIRSLKCHSKKLLIFSHVDFKRSFLTFYILLCRLDFTTLTQYLTAVKPNQIYNLLF